MGALFFLLVDLLVMVVVIGLDSGAGVGDGFLESVDLGLKGIVLGAGVDLGILKSLVELGLEVGELLAEGTFFGGGNSADDVVAIVFESGGQRVVVVILDELVELGQQSVVVGSQSIVVILVLFELVELIFRS